MVLVERVAADEVGLLRPTRALVLADRVVIGVSSDHRGFAVERHRAAELVEGANVTGDELRQRSPAAAAVSTPSVDVTKPGWAELCGAHNMAAHRVQVTNRLRCARIVIITTTTPDGARFRGFAACKACQGLSDFRALHLAELYTLKPTGALHSSLMEQLKARGHAVPVSGDSDPD
ncbi:MAG: hypothetical protein ACI9EF_001600 [Pseudohongiellaceae bacterium]